MPQGIPNRQCTTIILQPIIIKSWVINIFNTLSMFCGVPYYTRPGAFYVLICTVIFKLKDFVFNNVLFYNQPVCHMWMPLGMCNCWEHWVEFDRKNVCFYTNDRCIIRNSTNAFYMHTPGPWDWSGTLINSPFGASIHLISSVLFNKVHQCICMILKHTRKNLQSPSSTINLHNKQNRHKFVKEVP